MTVVTSQTVAEPAAFAYKAFVSYSHAADADLAPVLQSALQQFAKPWYRLRAMRIFRDKTGLSANPALWNSIETALAQSEFFLLLASPAAAASVWVRKEVEWWMQHRSPDRMLILLTEGDLQWAPDGAGFEAGTSSLPPGLSTYWREEPLWLDLRSIKRERNYSLRASPFRAAVLDVAATLRGAPKDELDGEDVRQHRRVRVISGFATVALAILAIVAALQARRATISARLANEARVLAETRRNEAEEARRLEAVARANAERERNLAESRRLVAQADLLKSTQPAAVELNALLTLEAARLAPPFEAGDPLRDAFRRLPLRTVQHGGPVNSVSFSSDGALLATGSWDRTARVTEIRTGKVLLEVPQAAMLRGVRFHANGRHVLLAAGPLVEMWDLATKTRVWSVSHSAVVDEFDLSRDGRRLAMAIDDGSVVVRETATGAETARSPRSLNKARHVVFSPDGELVAAGGETRNAVLFRASSGELVAALPHDGNVANALAFSLDGKQVALASESGTLHLFNAIDGAPIAQMRHDGSVQSVAFHPNGMWVATGSHDGSARMFVAGPSPQQTNRIEHGDYVDRITIGPNGRYWATDSSNKKLVRVFSLAPRAAALPLSSGLGGDVVQFPHPDFVFDIAFSPDGRYVATACQDKTARVFALGTADLAGDIVLGSRLFDLAFSPDAQSLAVATADGPARVFDVRGGAERWRFPAERGQRVAIGPDGRSIAVGNGSETIVSDIGGTVARPIAAHKYAVNDLAISGDGRWIADAGQDGLVTLFDRQTGKVALRLNHDGAAYAVAVSPDGRWLVVQSTSGVLVYDARNGKQAAKLNATAPLAFSPDGALLVAAPQMYRVADWSAVLNVGRGSNAAFSGDNRFLALADSLVVRLFDAIERRQIGQLTHWENVRGVMFTPDSRVLRTASGESALRIQDTPINTEDLVRAVCARLTRGFSDAEWRLYFGSEARRRACPP
jgi:WD40 repeat protein